MRCLFLLLSWLLLPAAAWAQGDIHRCMRADGVPVFTDRPCAAVNATPVTPAPTATVQAPPDPSRSLPVICAADIAQLKQAVVDAFAAHNPNHLAGLILWHDAGEKEVVSHIRQWGAWMDRPLLDVQASAQSDDVLVRTASDDGSGDARETRFAVLHQSGCLWLQPED